MKKHFYSHIVEIDSLIVALRKLSVSKQQQEHLIGLINDSLHHVILDAILSELSEEDKRKFLEHLFLEDDEKIWDHLHLKVENIEEKIKKAAEDLKKQLHKDIKEVSS